MTDQHTPGPWEWIEDGARLNAPSSGLVLSCDYQCSPCEADAHLIAAAPDMLAALTSLVEAAKHQAIHLNAARAAIAKAKGHSS